MKLSTIGISAALVVSFAHSAIGQVACGDVLGAGTHTMTANLSCANNPAVSLTGGATLDMKGHVITCTMGNNGISISGTGNRVINGGVDSCLNGFRVTGDGTSLANVTAVDSISEGVSITSSGNKFTRVVARGSGGANFASVGSTGNKFVECSGLGSTGGSGFHLVAASGSTFVRCIAEGNAFYGYFVNAGAGNTFAMNNATNNDVGFFLNGVAGAKLKGNFATGNGVGFQLVAVSDSAMTANVGTNSATVFDLNSTTSVFKKNRASSAATGFLLNGGSNKLVRNSTSSVTTGISILGSGDVISSNYIVGSYAVGIQAAGTLSRISKNVVASSGMTDLADPGACASNTWSNNVGATKLDGCEQ